jgi:hypothetical protein
VLVGRVGAAFMIDTGEMDVVGNLRLENPRHIHVMRVDHGSAVGRGGRVGH